MAGIALLFTACSDDEKQVVEQVTGPTEVSLISCDILSDETNQTGDLAWKKRRLAVLKMIETETPDIVCMQGQYWNQTVYLEQQLVGKYTLIDHSVEGDDSDKGFHNSLLYRTDKYTVVKEGRYWLSQKPTGKSTPWATKDNLPRINTWALLKDNTTHAQFYVASTAVNDGDLPEDQQARVNCASLIVSRFQEGQETDGTDFPVILAGNMRASYADTDARREGLKPYYDWMKSVRDNAAATDTKPSYNGLGRPASGACLVPDHIFVYKAQPLEFATLDSNYGVQYLSDHNPISCKVKF